MNTDKATARPWKVDIEELSITATEGVIALVCDDLSNKAEAEANAALIVRAVNSHDKLVAALNELRSLALDGNFNNRKLVKGKGDQVMSETEIDIRKSLPDLVELRALLLQSVENLKKSNKFFDDLLREIGAYSYYRLDRNGNTYGQGNEEKEIDQRLWLYLVRSFHLERYMLCTEHKKMMDQISDYNFPEFTRENAEAWLESLKAKVYESVEKLIKDVFNRITEKTYYTGSGYSSRQEKKRNNNGIDKNFILTTYDYNAVFSYSSNPTITDDLEKACYIIDGKYVPDKRLKEVMRSNKSSTGENDYFALKLCKNGNTHYTMKEDIRQKLNLYGAGRGVISDGIKIKIFDKKGW